MNKIQRDGIQRTAIFGWFYIMNRIERRLPDKLNWVIIQIHWLPFFTFILKESDGMWKAWKPFRRNFYFPSLEQHSRARKESHRYKRQQYSFDGFVEVEGDDVVFDIGAFLGQYSLGIADRCDRVIALEPNPKSAACTRLNTPSNVKVLQKAAWKGNGRTELQLGLDGSEDSLIEPDDGGSGSKVEVETVTVDHISSEYGIKTIDLLKIEAEGVEPEILSGADSVNIKEIVVNAGAERYGEDVIDEIVGYLRERGYETRIENDFVFGKQS